MRLFSFFSLLGIAHAITSSPIHGLSWFGHETDTGKFTCTWQHPQEYYLEKLQDMGFNSLRVPFSYQYVKNGDFSDLDHFFDIVGNYNMSVVLDFHRINNYAQSPVPTDGISQEEFWDAWVKIADRYKNRNELIALELFNEEQYPGTLDNIEYWNNFMKQTIFHIEDRIPQRFDYIVNGHSWGGSLVGISLEDLPIKDRIMYSIHKYIFSSNSVPADWDVSFGDYPDQVIVTEWGFRTPDEGEDQTGWARIFINYLKQNHIKNTYFWCLSHSADTKALFYDNCEDVNWEKLKILKTLWEDDEKRMLRWR
jgi:aryl-phospho-beta-D-glucosidase BglC (GH1 family)